MSWWRRAERMNVPAPIERAEAEVYSTPGGRFYVQTLARGCSPRVAAQSGQAFAAEVVRLHEERAAAYAQLIRREVHPVSDIDLTRVRLASSDHDAPWLECLMPGCAWSSETVNPGHLDNVTVDAVVVLAEAHLDTHRERP